MPKPKNNRKQSKAVRIPDHEQKQMKFRLLGILFVVLVFAAAVSLIYYWQMAYQPLGDGFFQPVRRGQKTEIYTNTAYGFLLNYDKKYQLDSSGSKTNFFKHPAISLASVSIPQTLYPKTNFGSADLTVAVQLKSLESSCIAAAGTEEINGTRFYKSEQDGGAAGTHYQTKIYRTFQNKNCFEISLTTGIANIDNYPPGTVSEIDQSMVWGQLDQILKTFKFTGSNTSSSTNTFPSTGAAFGILSGPVIIGPNCPANRAGFECPQTQEAFNTVQIIVYQTDGKTEVARMNPKPETANGPTLLASYSFNLQEGKYLADYSSTSGLNTSHKMRPVTVLAGKTTNLDFNIDTGIR